jgi:hypothetical protein
MVGKAQKSHGARSELYGRYSNGVPPIHFFQAEHRISWRSVFLVKLVVSQLVKKLPTSYRTQRFIIVFTKARVTENVCNNS